jgi:uncharacterized protein (DUF4415 family)
MSSDKKILDIANNIIKKNPEIFEALVEFEKTKKLPKLNYKQRVNFTIDTNIFKKFREYCQRHGYKMSTKIEQFILKEIS